MTRIRHKPCKGTGMIWKRLVGIGVDGKPIDDGTGDLSCVMCWDCRGSGYVDRDGRPARWRHEL